MARKALRRIFDEEPDLEIAGTAHDGRAGIEKALRLRPDVIILNPEVPVLGWLEVLKRVVSEGVSPLIVCGSSVCEGSAARLEALEHGAFDCVYRSHPAICTALRRELLKKIRLAVRCSASRAARHTAILLKREKKRLEGGTSPGVVREGAIIGVQGRDAVRRAVVIGASTGGPRTLMKVIPKLPAELGAPVFLVQHMPVSFTAAFARRLDKYSALTVTEAEEGETIRNNVLYIAKGGFHMLLRRDKDGKIVLHLDRSPPHTFIPSVDVMMESVLNLFGPNLVGVLLTGMGNDGAASLGRIRAAGGYTVAESEETAVVWGMPGEAVRRNAVDAVLPADTIADAIVRELRRRQRKNEVVAQKRGRRCDRKMGCPMVDVFEKKAY